MSSPPSEPASFEQALSELEAIVRSLETGQLTLEQAIEGYERGVRLRAYCQKTLEAARLRVEKITLDTGGNIATEPFPLA